MKRCLVIAAFAGIGAVAGPSSLRATEPVPSGETPDDAPDGGGGSGNPGRLLRYEEPPEGASSWPRACDAWVPICVRRGPGASRALTLAVLRTAVEVTHALTETLLFPRPLGGGPDGALEIILGASGPHVGFLERTLLGGFDGARAFVSLPVGSLPTLGGPTSVALTCDAQASLAQALARASLLRNTPAADEGSATATAAYLARLLVPCAMGLPRGVDTFQGSPERTPVDTEGAPGALEGAALLPWWLDFSFGTRPGVVPLALFAMSPSKTPLGASRWTNEPDVFDVLRISFRGAFSASASVATRTTLGDLFLQFAAARPFVGAGGSVALPEARSLGAAGAVVPAWDLPWPATPRRLASPLPVAPLGASYLRVDTSSAPKGARLRVEAAWEEHASFRWAAVKVDAAGQPVAQVPFPSVVRATEVRGDVLNLEGVAAVWLVAMNAGDPAFGFDPDDEVWEPHGWLLTLAGQQD